MTAWCLSVLEDSRLIPPEPSPDVCRQVHTAVCTPTGTPGPLRPPPDRPGRWSILLHGWE